MGVLGSDVDAVVLQRGFRLPLFGMLLNPRVVLRCTCMTRLIIPVNPEPTTLRSTIRLVNS